MNGKTNSNLPTGIYFIFFCIFLSYKIIKLNFQHAKREHHFDVDVVMVDKYLFVLFI